MRIMNNDIQVGSEICFFEGKDNKLVARDLYGKVILCKHKIPFGYAKVLSVEEREKYYLVTAEHIIKDIYSGINYEEFLQVLPLHGFKLGFDRIFDHEMDGITLEEHQVFAYHPENKSVLVGETFKWEENSRMTFNSLRIYLPGASCVSFQRNRMFYSGSNQISVLDVGSTSRGEIGVLAYVNDMMSRFGGDWPEIEYPNLWTYEKSDNKEHDEDGNWILGKWSLQRLKLADPECLKIFKGCKWLKELEVDR